MNKTEAIDRLMRLWMERRGSDQQFVNRELVPLGKQEVQRAIQQNQWAVAAEWADALAVILGQTETIEEDSL
jgi:hypothetical protein